MTNTKKINNAPYYTAGALAIIFSAVAVASIAALYMGLPALIFASVGAACILLATTLFSVLSVAAIRNNKAIAKQETQLAENAKEIKAINETLAKQKDKLTGKAEEIKAINETLAGQETQLIKQVASVSEERDKLIEANRMLQEMLQEEDNRFAESLFNDHNDDAKRERQKTRQDKFDRLVAKRKQEETSVPSNQPPIALAYKDTEKETQLKGNHSKIAVQSRVKSTKAVSQQKKSNRFSTKAKTLGALSVISAIVASGVPNYLFNQVNSDISLANNFTDVGDLHNNYCPNSSYIHPNNTQAMLDNKLGQVEKMLSLSQERDKEDFGVDPDKRDFVDDKSLEESTLINDTGTVEQNISTSVYSRMKDMFFNLLISNLEDKFLNLFTSNVEAVEESTHAGQNDPTFASDPCYTVPSGFVCNNRTTDYVTPPIQTNGIAAQNTTALATVAVVEGSTQVGQNDPTQGCAVLNVRKYDNQTFVSNPCAPGDHQVPLGLQDVALCCPSIPESAPPRSAPPSGP